MEGETQEIWSCVVTLGTQRVDTQGAVPNKESHSPFMYYQSWGMEARMLARLHQCHSSFSLPGVVQHETGIITVLPPVCLPSVCLVTKSFRPSPSVYAYRKRSNTGVRNGLGMRLRQCTYLVMQNWCNIRTCISYTQCVFWFKTHHPGDIVDIWQVEHGMDTFCDFHPHLMLTPHLSLFIIHKAQNTIHRSL